MISRIFPNLVFSRIQSILWKTQPIFCSARTHFVQIGSVFQLMQTTLHDYLSPLMTSLFLCSYLLAQFYSYIWVINGHVGSFILPGSPRHHFWWLMAAFHHLSFSTYLTYLTDMVLCYSLKLSIWHQKCVHCTCRTAVLLYSAKLIKDPCHSWYFPFILYYISLSAF